jgi:ATPase subunit of ABC transporter with duplicated ATPase domains
VEEWRKQQARAREAVEKQKEKLREFISREGKKYDNPAHQSQRKMKIKQLEQLAEVDAVEEEGHLVMHFPEPNGVFEDHETLIEVSGPASFGWPDKEPLFTNAEFNVKSKERIVILGKNGCGKTCLLQILTGELFPIKGRVTRHAGARIAMLQQHHYKGDQLDPNPLLSLPSSSSSLLGTINITADNNNYHAFQADTVKDNFDNIQEESLDIIYSLLNYYAYIKINVISNYISSWRGVHYYYHYYYYYHQKFTSSSLSLNLVSIAI